MYLGKTLGEAGGAANRTTRALHLKMMTIDHGSKRYVFSPAILLDTVLCMSIAMRIIKSNDQFFKEMCYTQKDFNLGIFRTCGLTPESTLHAGVIDMEMTRNEECDHMFFTIVQANSQFLLFNHRFFFHLQQLEILEIRLKSFSLVKP